jgi:NADH-quinone oxidoreductase subunit J
LERIVLRLWLGAIVLVGLLAFPALAANDGAATGERAGVTDAAPPGGLTEVVAFYGVAAATIVAALGVCVAKNIIRMAVWLFIALGSVAMLYFLLAATFIGAIQLIVYVGGTLILLIFGVMLTSKSPWVRFDPPKIELLGAAVVCGALLVALCIVLIRAIWRGTETVVPGASVADLGRSLITTYLVPFEVAGVLLMIVMVGAAYLARQEKS